LRSLAPEASASANFAIRAIKSIKEQPKRVCSANLPATRSGGKEGRQTLSPSMLVITSLSIYEHPLGVSTIFRCSKRRWIVNSKHTILIAQYCNIEDEPSVLLKKASEDRNYFLFPQPFSIMKSLILDKCKDDS
jgi:hypothetical protein